MPTGRVCPLQPPGPPDLDDGLARYASAGRWPWQRRPAGLQVATKRYPPEKNHSPARPTFAPVKKGAGRHPPGSEGRPHRQATRETGMNSVSFGYLYRSANWVLGVTAVVIPFVALRLALA